MITEQGRRVAVSMRERLEAFSGGISELRRLTAELEGLLGLLSDEADAEWVEELRSQWWHLEYVLSIVVTQSRKDLTVDEIDEVKDAVAQLQQMLTEYVDIDSE